MKIAVSTSGKDLDAQIDQRFGRCEQFLIVDTDTMETHAYPNEGSSQTGGAGVQAAAFVIAQGARAVLTGTCGPKAMDVFNAEGIPVYTGQAGAVRKAVQAFKDGTLAASESRPPDQNRETSLPPVQRGVGGGGGMGGGRGLAKGGGRGIAGGGRGMGGGGGQGMGGGRGMGGGGGCRRGR
jgi:predicted Fe-Mo cluster-binding NifX family protein